MAPLTESGNLGCGEEPEETGHWIMGFGGTLFLDAACLTVSWFTFHHQTEQ